MKQQQIRAKHRHKICSLLLSLGISRKKKKQKKKKMNVGGWIGVASAISPATCRLRQKWHSNFWRAENVSCHLFLWLWELLLIFCIVRFLCDFWFVLYSFLFVWLVGFWVLSGKTKFWRSAALRPEILETPWHAANDSPATVRSTRGCRFAFASAVT